MWKETKKSWRDATTEASEGLPWFIIVVVVIAAVSVLSWYGWAYFAPKTVAVQSQVFHESQQYNDGMVRDLENLRMEYLRSTPDQQTALRATIRHRFAGYDVERLTPELRSFYDSLR